MAKRYVGRGGEKLAFALERFGVDVTGWTCADFGSAVGGFVDCLLDRGAAKVYAVDTGWGVLDWKLRNDQRVVVMERTNAMHVALPEAVDLVTVDAGWTRQWRILPHALGCTKPGGAVISLLKPHYECRPSRRIGGVVRPEEVDGVVADVLAGLKKIGMAVGGVAESPIRGGKGGNREFLILVRASLNGRRSASGSRTG